MASVLAALVLATGVVIAADTTTGSRRSRTSQSVVPATVSAAGVSGGAAAGAGLSLPGRRSETSAAVIAENARPGSAAWNLTDPSVNHQIEGYADEVSIDAGEPVTLYVSTAAPSFDVQVFRMGWYQGLGARLIGSSDELPGVRQSAAIFTPGINMIETSWQPSVAFNTANWPPGDYLFKLNASTGPQSWIPLTVRDDASTAAYVVINSVTTWQAYNLWGDYDLYQGYSGAYADRSRVVSFDRPYSVGHGAADFLGLEYPLVQLAESLGLDVTYMTDIDLSQTPNPLLDHKAVLSLGHDEYYSLTMRNNMQAARDHGVNLAFLGANAMYRHIRLDASPLGANRHEICYKAARADPLYGADNADVTVDWRDPPTDNPESQIIGDYYQCNPVHADMVIADPASWLFAGTGVTAGQMLKGVIATEYDRYDPNVPSPPDVEILAHSPLTCGGQPDYADATYYTAPSGAGVFASGTIAFIPDSDIHCQPAGCPGQVLGKVVENLLAGFGKGPAGMAHPSDPAESTVIPPPPVVASFGGALTAPPATGGGNGGETEKAPH